MVAFNEIGFNQLLCTLLGKRLTSSFAVLRTPVPEIPISRVYDPSFRSSSFPRSFSSIPDAAGLDETEYVESANIGQKPMSLSSIFEKPKYRTVSSVGETCKHVVSNEKRQKSSPFTSSVRYRPMEEKEFPNELLPEVVALVSRLQQEGYLKEANLSQVGSLNPREVKPNLYSRHFLKSAAEKFGQNQQEIAKWLSGNHLKKVAVFGCPSVERKTVFAAKRLRSFFNIQEDVICRGCKIRSSCKFLYQKVSREEKVILSDTMRILTLLAFDSVPKQLYIPSELKSSVCKLLKEVLDLSA